MATRTGTRTTNLLNTLAGIGQYATLEPLGHGTESSWHDDGHMNLANSGDPDMGDPRTAVRAANNLFWRWHTVVDLPRRERTAMSGGTLFILQNNSTLQPAQ